MKFDGLIFLLNYWFLLLHWLIENHCHGERESVRNNKTFPFLRRFGLWYPSAGCLGAMRKVSFASLSIGDRWHHHKYLVQLIEHLGREKCCFNELSSTGLNMAVRGVAVCAGPLKVEVISGCWVNEWWGDGDGPLTGSRVRTLCILCHLFANFTTLGQLMPLRDTQGCGHQILTSVGHHNQCGLVSWSPRSPWCVQSWRHQPLWHCTPHYTGHRPGRAELSAKHSVSQFIPHFKLHTHWFPKTCHHSLFPVNLLH